MHRHQRFEDRARAGKALAVQLFKERLVGPVVMAMPRGGVPVAAEVALALDAPLDLVFVRRVAVPFHSELAAAAVVDGVQPEILINSDVAMQAGMGEALIRRRAEAELVEIERQRQLYVGSRPRADIYGRDVILVDDGISTGVGVRAALAALKKRFPRQIVVAVPVAPVEIAQTLSRDLNRLICLETPMPFYGIGAHYLDFVAVTDAEIVRLIEKVDALQHRQMPTRELDFNEPPRSGLASHSAASEARLIAARR